MRFILLYRIEEQTYNNKNRHVPLEQIIYDYQNYIEFNLTNMT